MFEGIVSTVLTRVLGDYIEDIDKKSLNISVWSGTINLKDLRLKKATFDSLTVDLPISVVHGYVGTIDAKIPWSSLGSVPVVATIKDVFIVVQPKKCVQWDEKLAQNTKKNALNPKEPSASQDSSFISHLVETIVNNLQLTLENVHIRYEDISDPLRHIKFGIKLGSLGLESTDENWLSAFVDTFTGPLFKQLEIKSLSVYGGQDPFQFTQFEYDYEQFVALWEKLNSYISFEYLMEPMFGICRLKMFLNEWDAQNPQVRCDLNFPNICIHMNDEQFKDILALTDYLIHYQQFEQYRKYVPKTLSARGTRSSKDLWTYAIEAVRSESEGRFFTWDNVTRRRKYMDLYKRSQRLPWLSELDPWDQETLNYLEKEFSLECLSSLRTFADEEVKSERLAHKRTSTHQKSWSDWLLGRTDLAQDDELHMTNEERKFLYEKIGYNEDKQEKKLDPYDVRIVVNFQIVGGTVQLRHGKSNIVSLEYNKFKTIAQVRENSSLMLQVSLLSALVKDGYSKNTKFRNIFACEESKEPLLQFSLDTSPFDEQSDLLVQAQVQPTKMILNVPLLQRISTFFGTVNEETIQVAKNQLQSSAARIQHALENRKIIQVKLQVQVPKIYIPFDLTKSDSEFLLVDLGSCVVDSLSKKKQVKKNEYYDSYSITLHPIRISHSNQLDILEQSKIECKLDRLVVDSDKLASLKTEVTVSRVRVNINPSTLSCLVRATNQLLDLVDQPDTYAKHGLHDGFLTLTQGPATNNEYWCELHDNGTLMLFESEIASRKPLAKLNLTKDTVIVYDKSTNYGVHRGREVPDREDLNERQFVIELPNCLDGETRVGRFVLEAPTSISKKRWCDAVHATSIKFHHIAMNKPKPKPQNFLVTAKVTLTELSLHFAKRVDQSLAEIALSNVTLDTSLSNTSVQVNLKLNAFLIADLSTKRRQNAIVSSHDPADRKSIRNLAEISIHQNFDFEQVGTEQADTQVQVKLFYLHFYFEPLFLARMVRFGKETSKVMNDLSRRAKYFAANAPKIIRQNQMHVSATIKKIGVSLIDHELLFTRLSLTNANIKLNVHANATLVAGDVGNVVVEHLADDTRQFTEILGLANTGPSLIVFNYSSNPNTLALRIESTKFFCDFSALDKLKKFFTSGPLVRELGPSEPSTGTSAPMLLDISINKPIIIIPRSQTSSDRIIIHANSIVIANDHVAINAIGVQAMLSAYTYTVFDDTYIDIAIIKDGKNTNVNITTADTLSLKITHSAYEALFQLIDDLVNAPSSPPSEPSTEDAGETRININLPKGYIELLRGNTDTLLAISVYELGIGISNTNVNVSVGGLHIHDVRPEATSLHKTILDVRHSDRAFIIVDILFDGPLVKIVIEIDKPRITIEPSIIMALTDFFSQTITAPKLQSFTTRTRSIGVGDLKIQRNTWLGNDVVLSKDHKLVIEKNETGRVTIDGEGHTITLNNDEHMALISVADGMVVKLKNITLRYEGELESWITYGAESRLEYAATANVICLTLEETRITSPSQESADNWLFLTFDLKQPTLLLPIEPQKQNSKQLVVKTGIHVSIANNTTSIRVNDLKLFVSQPETNIRVAPIIEPFSLAVDMIGSECIRANISNSVRARIAYQDIKMFIQVANAFKKPVFSEDEAIDMALQNEYATDSEDTLSEAGSVESDEFDDIVSATSRKSSTLAPLIVTPFDKSGQFDIAFDITSPQTATVPRMITPARTKLSLFFDMKNELAVTVVDDARGVDVPLLELSLSDVHVFDTILSKWNDVTQIEANAVAVAKIEFFNAKIADWQSVLDPYAFEIAFTRTPQFKTYEDQLKVAGLTTDSLKKYKMHATPVLTVKLSQAMIHTIINTAKLWQDEFSGNAISENFEAYQIHNHSGTPITVTVKDVEQVIEPFLVWRFTPQRSSWKEKLPVRVKFSDYDEVLEFDGRIEGIIHGSISVAEISTHENARRVITVRSPYKIVNRSNVAWSFGNDKVAFVVLQPGDSCGVPINVVQSNSLSIRTAFTEEWAYTGVIFKELDDIDALTVRCTDGQYTVLRIIDGQIIEIIPPLILENLMGCNIHYKLHSHEFITEGVMEPGDKKYMYGADPTNDMLLYIHPPDWKQEFPIVVHSLNEEKIVSNCTVTKDTRQLRMFLDYSQEHALREIKVFCPYWLVNRTGFQLTVSDVHGREVDVTSGTPVMFSFTSGPKKIRAKVNDSTWSEYFNIDRMGVVTDVLCRAGDRQYCPRVNTTLGYMNFNRTKVVSFTPRCTLINRTESTLEFRRGNNQEVLTLEPQQVQNYWIEKKVKKVTVTMTGTWSDAEFSIHQLGDTYIRLVSGLSARILTVSIREKEGTFFVVIEQPLRPPFLIDNQLSMDILAVQREDVVAVMEKHAKTAFAWDDCINDPYLELVINDERYRIDVSQSDDRVRQLQDQTFVRVKSRGSTKIIQLLDDYNKIDREDNTRIMEERTQFAVQAIIPAFGIVVIARGVEIAYVLMEQLRVNVELTKRMQAIDIDLGRLQIDNQNNDAVYPILLVNRRKLYNSFLSLSLRVRDDMLDRVIFRMEETSLKIEYMFVEEVMGLANEIMNVFPSDDQDTWLESVSHEIVQPMDVTKLFFDRFDFGPILVHTTFHFNRSGNFNPFFMLLEGIGFTVANVDDAPLYLRPFVLDQSILTTDTLLERISIHYVNCALRQTYKVVGSLEAIGNPYGLVMDVIQGTQELGSAFVEGIVEGPLLYKDILKNGHRSMQSHIIHGMLRTFSRLAGTVARGVSYASFDADYVKRNERVDARQPSNMKEGIFQGGRALVSGIYEGATDVLVHTFKERGGVRKAIGFAKGLLSIPTKPITGAMEFIAKVAAGFSNSRYLQHRRMRQEIHV